MIHAAIAGSIATFQLGEQSSGANLLRAAYRFAQEQDAPEVARITELLIREEQQHAALLRSFMSTHGISTKQHDWTDRIFRRLKLNLSDLASLRSLPHVRDAFDTLRPGESLHFEHRDGSLYGLERRLNEGLVLGVESGRCLVEE